MKTITLGTLLVLFSLAGVATAGNASDESDYTIDQLEPVNGRTFFVKCMSYGPGGTCLGPTVWEDTNPVPGLQTSKLTVGSQQFDQDKRLLN